MYYVYDSYLQTDPQSGKIDIYIQHKTDPEWKPPRGNMLNKNAFVFCGLSVNILQ